MKTGARMIGGFLVALTLALMGSPAAQADDDSFVRAAHTLGFVLASDNLISTARSACYFLRLNRDSGQVLARIIRYTRAEPDQGRQFFALAINEYCPQYAGVAGT
jgi:hypothetical protein